MIDKIKEVLKGFQNQQFNIDSDSAINLLAQKINDNINDNLEIERMKLSEQIVEHYGDGYIFESPDGGNTVFRRKFQDYDPNNKEEIDWKTKEPTGRKFSDYNNGNWKKYSSVDDSGVDLETGKASFTRKIQYAREVEDCGTQDAKLYPKSDER